MSQAFDIRGSNESRPSFTAASPPPLRLACGAKDKMDDENIGLVYIT